MHSDRLKETSEYFNDPEVKAAQAAFRAKVEAIQAKSKKRRRAPKLAGNPNMPIGYRRMVGAEVEKNESENVSGFKPVVD